MDQIQNGDEIVHNIKDARVTLVYESKEHSSLAAHIPSRMAVAFGRMVSRFFGSEHTDYTPETVAQLNKIRNEFFYYAHNPQNGERFMLSEGTVNFKSTDFVPGREFEAQTSMSHFVIRVLDVQPAQP